MKNRKEKQSTLGVFTDIALQKGLLPLIAVILLLVAIPVTAQEKSADDWQFGTQVYLWGATMKLHTPTGDPITITFGDIMRSLDLAAMVSFDARKNKFSMLADVIYMDLSKDLKRGEFMGLPVEGKLNVGINAWVLNFIGGYTVFDSGKNVFDVAAGARYLTIDVPVTIKLDDKKFKTTESGSGWDGVVGFKGRHNFPDGHYFNYYADIGGGNAKTTWQTAVSFAYDYKKFTGIVGYRYLKWNFKNDAPALDDLTIHGPYAGLKWTF